MQKRWYHSANHSFKWDGLSQDHLSNATTPLQLESPTKPSSPAKQSQWTCSSTGSDVEMLKASSDTSGHLAPTILVTTTPRSIPKYTTSPNRRSDRLPYTSLGSLQVSSLFFLSLLTILTARVCRSTGIPPVSTVPVNIIFPRSVLLTGQD